MTATAGVARAEGAKPSVFYSSTQAANGLGDIASPKGLRAALNQGAPV